MRYPSSIQNLIDKLSLLPSVGPKTAERYVFYLLNQTEEKINDLAEAIKELKQKTTLPYCLAASESNPALFALMKIE